MSHPLTVNLSDFIFILTPWNECIIKIMSTSNHTIILSLAFSTFEAIVLNLLVVNLSLNQSLLIFLNIQLILAISLWRIVFLWFEKIFLLIICMVLHFMWRRDFRLHATYFWKALRILLYIFNWVSSFSPIDHLPLLCAQVSILFHLT